MDAENAHRRIVFASPPRAGSQRPPVVRTELELEQESVSKAVADAEAAAQEEEWRRRAEQRRLRLNKEHLLRLTSRAKRQIGTQRGARMAPLELANHLNCSEENALEVRNRLRLALVKAPAAPPAVREVALLPPLHEEFASMWERASGAKKLVIVTAILWIPWLLTIVGAIIGATYFDSLALVVAGLIALAWLYLGIMAFRTAR